MNLDFEGRSVLVTGAARGIGQGIIRAFLDAGARVLALDILAAELERLRDSLGAGDRLTPMAIDLSQADAVEAALRDVAADVVVHAAGGVCGQSPRAFEQVPDSDWMDIYAANVLSAVHVLRAVVPGMKRRGSGRIVTISSGAGLKPSRTGIQSYCSAKHGLVGLTRQLALELGPFGITVNSVAPGFLRTSPDYERQWQSYGPERQRTLVEGIAMRRLGTPQDIAAAVLFFASSHAGWITGQVLPVSGHPFP